MKWILVAASVGLWAWLVPSISIAQEPDSDGDGISDELDNCSDTPNTNQDDSDFDDCGNLCDADYNNNGIVDFGDFGLHMLLCFGPNPPEILCHIEPVVPCNCTFGDFGFVLLTFGEVPGPSGATLGTTACP